MPKRPKYVAYYRVSTQRQGASGLGLEAQRAAVAAYDGAVAAEFVEIESGGRNDRPQLRKALERCRATGATLLIAKLDRLARRVSFIANLMESGVDFVAADMPQANRLTVHILAAVAEAERAAISERTKAAIAARAARGKPWSHPKPPAGTARSAARARAARGAATSERRARIRGKVAELRADGVTSLRAIAAALNAQGYATERGKQWHAASVARFV